MTTTQNADDLLIVSDEVKTDSDFLFFDSPVEENRSDDSIISFEETKPEEKSDIDFFASFNSNEKEDEKLEQKEILSEEVKEEIISFENNLEKMEEEVKEEVLETSNDNFSFDIPAISEIKEETYSTKITESMTNTVGDLNAILEETISKLELRKTNLGALKTDKTSTIDDLNKQIEALKSQVKELQGEVKGLESEDEQIINNITALQSMKMGEVANNKDYKKTTKKVA